MSCQTGLLQCAEMRDLHSPPRCYGTLTHRSESWWHFVYISVDICEMRHVTNAMQCCRKYSLGSGFVIVSFRIEIIRRDRGIAGHECECKEFERPLYLEVSRRSICGNFHIVHEWNSGGPTGSNFVGFRNVDTPVVNSARFFMLYTLKTLINAYSPRN